MSCSWKILSISRNRFLQNVCFNSKRVPSD